jgi:cytochrome o ubiquinol oxidase operon protein cyoD
MTKLTAYITGFVLSLVLTVLPLALLRMHEAGGHAFPTHEMLYAAFVLFAILQLLVQLFFFFHMDEEARPRWNLTALCFALLVVTIVVGGTLWIMHNLSHMQHDAQLPFIHGAITPAGSND